MLLFFASKKSAALLTQGAAPFAFRKCSPQGQFPTLTQTTCIPLLPPPPPPAPCIIWDPCVSRQAKRCQLPRSPHLTSPPICLTLQDFSLSCPLYAGSSTGTLITPRQNNTVGSRQSTGLWRSPHRATSVVPSSDFHLLAKRPYSVGTLRVPVKPGIPPQASLVRCARSTR